ncbi:MAG: hypothetical protein KC457_25440 [Myxococcales bacterium]|nr:hypothetical protein [Myxococcales bacterium]
MAANDYHFVEQWFIPDYGPAQVYAVLANASILPQWWKGVYQRAFVLGDYSEPVVGARVRVRAKGWLPYHLDFDLEALCLQPGRVVEVEASGDFHGIWRATLHAEAGGTRVELDWRVTVTKPVVRWLSPLLRPLFAWNHRWTTPRGERGMIAHLDRVHGRRIDPCDSHHRLAMA